METPEDVRDREECHVSMEELSRVLWRQRELLELVLFKLEEHQLLLESGRTRWLGLAAREVDVLLDQFRRTELLRAVTADGLAAAVGLPPGPRLRDLARMSEEPWCTILLDHREALLALTAEVKAMSTLNQVLLVGGGMAEAGPPKQEAVS
jgi:hypothetical protein